jgi:hypothetical protein
MRATFGLLGKIAAEIRESGTFGFTRGVPTYADINALFAERESASRT